VKAKIGRGAGFRGTLNYALDKAGPDVELFGNMTGKNARELAREFAVAREQRPEVERPVWHSSLSSPPGERLTDQQWRDVAGDYVKRMGFSELHPWVAVRHSDEPHDHIHIVASRIGLDGQLWLGQRDVFKAIEVTQQLELEHGLTRTPGLKSRAEKKAPTLNEARMAERTGVEPPKVRLQRLVDEAVKEKPTTVQFAQRLEGAGVTVRANVASTGKMNGYSFELDGVAFKGSALGKNYTWAALQKRGVSLPSEKPPPTPEGWRGTLVAALAESERTAAGRQVGFVAGDWAESSRVRISTSAQLIERAQKWSPPGTPGADDPIYSVTPDGTVENTRTGRDVYRRVEPDHAGERYPTALAAAVDQHFGKGQVPGHPGQAAPEEPDTSPSPLD
jgi:hypothetical protein